MDLRHLKQSADTLVGEWVPSEKNDTFEGEEVRITRTTYVGRVNYLIQRKTSSTDKLWFSYVQYGDEFENVTRSGLGLIETTKIIDRELARVAKDEELSDLDAYTAKLSIFNKCMELLTETKGETYHGHTVDFTVEQDGYFLTNEYSFIIQHGTRIAYVSDSLAGVEVTRGTFASLDDILKLISE